MDQGRARTMPKRQEPRQRLQRNSLNSSVGAHFGPFDSFSHSWASENNCLLPFSSIPKKNSPASSSHMPLFIKYLTTGAFLPPPRYLRCAGRTQGQLFLMQRSQAGAVGSSCTHPIFAVRQQLQAIFFARSGSFVLDFLLRLPEARLLLDATGPSWEGTCGAPGRNAGPSTGRRLRRGTAGPSEGSWLRAACC